MLYNVTINSSFALYIPRVVIYGNHKIILKLKFIMIYRIVNFKIVYDFHKLHDIYLTSNDNEKKHLEYMGQNVSFKHTATSINCKRRVTDIF